MGFLLTQPVRVLIALLRLLPVGLAVRIGRAFGAVAWWILRRHRRVALENLTAVFGQEFSAGEIRRLARENFRRLGENYVGAVWTSGRTFEEIQQVLEVSGLEQVPAEPVDHANLVFATGHFGNFDLCGGIASKLPKWRAALTYRALHPPELNRLLVGLRARSGLRSFERTSEARALRSFMSEGGVALGLLGDQHGGPKGLWLPFLGHPCSVSPAPVLLAQRYRAPIASLLCFRIALGRWRVEIGPLIPVITPDGAYRDPAEVMHEINATYEAAIRRDPANWFWVHRRWKPASQWQRDKLARSPAGPVVSDHGPGRGT